MKSSKFAWDKIFQEKGKYYDDVHPDINQFVRLLNQQDGRRVLDLGSGSGRHTVHLAKLGFQISSLDISPTGVNTTQSWLKQERLTAIVKQGDITNPLPYPDNYFDGVISTQVIHHAERNTVYQIIDEITRVLKPGGVIFVSVPLFRGYSRKHPGWTMDKLAERTYLPLDGQEKGMIHYFFTEEEFTQAWPAFTIKLAYHDPTNHYAILAVKN